MEKAVKQPVVSMEPVIEHVVIEEPEPVIEQVVIDQAEPVIEHVLIDEPIIEVPTFKEGLECTNGHALQYSKKLKNRRCDLLECRQIINTKLGSYCCISCGYDCCRNCYKGEVAPLEFSAMTLHEKLEAITEEMLYTYPLVAGHMRVPSHQCALVQKTEDHEGTANCDRVRGAHKCLSGLTGFY